MRWLTSGSVEAVTGALRTTAPELADLPLSPRPDPAESDPRWWSSSARLGEAYVVKYAWSPEAARRLVHEQTVLRVLRSDVPLLPEVVLATTEPVLLVTRRVVGSSLFQAIDHLDRDHAGRQVAAFLAALHARTTRDRLAAAVPDLGPAPLPPTPDELRTRLPRWIPRSRWPAVQRWCDWADRILRPATEPVLVHADLHGDNQVWVGDELRLVLDLETVGLGEPEYDLRAVPGPGSDVDLLRAVARHYTARTGRVVDLDRVMAWHTRTVLGDILWRREAGIALADHRRTGAWVDDLERRLRDLAIDVR